MHKHLLALVLGIASTVGAASLGLATPITYTETDTASGSLGGIAFTNANIVLTENSDITNVVNLGSGIFHNVGTVTLTVNGGSPVNFTDTTLSVSNGVGGVGFSDLTVNRAILLDNSSAFLTYDLTTSIGPITGTATFNSGQSFSTTGGAFVLTSVGNPTFTATTSVAVPAPPVGRGLPVLLAVWGVLAGARVLERQRRTRRLRC